MSRARVAGSLGLLSALLPLAEPAEFPEVFHYGELRDSPAYVTLEYPSLVDSPLAPLPPGAQYLPIYHAKPVYPPIYHAKPFYPPGSMIEDIPGLTGPFLGGSFASRSETKAKSNLSNVKSALRKALRDYPDFDPTEFERLAEAIAEGVGRNRKPLVATGEQSAISDGVKLSTVENAVRKALRGYPGFDSADFERLAEAIAESVASATVYRNRKSDSATDAQSASSDESKLRRVETALKKVLRDYPDFDPAEFERLAEAIAESVASTSVSRSRRPAAATDAQLASSEEAKLSRIEAALKKAFRDYPDVEPAELERLAEAIAESVASTSVYRNKKLVGSTAAPAGEGGESSPQPMDQSIQQPEHEAKKPEGETEQQAEMQQQQQN